MFTDRNGTTRMESERIAETIENPRRDDLDSIGRRKQALSRSLILFKANLETLTDEQRTAALSLLYKGVTDLLFDFQLSLATSDARTKIKAATSREEKLLIVDDFEGFSKTLASLHAE